MSQSAELSIAPSVSAYFQEVLSDAFRARQVEATDATTIYLVDLLCGFAHPDERAGSTFDKPLTFQLHDALEAAGADRFQRLRSLGDHVLYALGFFGGHMETKGVDRGYVVGVGSSAYRHAAAMLRLRTGRPEPDGDARRGVLSELASGFARFADVLRDVAEGTLASGAKSERTLVRLYERWLRTGSTRIAEELGAQGILPTRGAGGLN